MLSGGRFVINSLSVVWKCDRGNIRIQLGLQPRWIQTHRDICPYHTFKQWTTNNIPILIAFPSSTCITRDVSICHRMIRSCARPTVLALISTIAYYMLYNWCRNSQARGMQASLTSNDIETQYLKTPEGSIDFSTEEHEYRLDFITLRQKNLNSQYRTERSIRRRPQYQASNSHSSLQAVGWVANPLETLEQSLLFPNHRCGMS